MKRRILLVDDELPILLTMRAILELSRFEVETAASVVEAVSKLKQGVFDMVITDMRMPDSNLEMNDRAGYEVLRAARQAPYNPATAILTAFPEFGSEWERRGAHSLLVKPMNTQELLAKIQELLRRHDEQKPAHAMPARAAGGNGRTRTHQRKAG
jgi:DNA-binding response OmpR family regulator